MVRKVTVSLPDELAARIDAEAESLGVSRSEVVQEASARYLSMTAEQRAEDSRRRRAFEAIDEMRRISALPSLDPRPTLEVLRDVRDTDEGDPAAPHALEGTDAE